MAVRAGPRHDLTVIRDAMLAAIRPERLVANQLAWGAGGLVVAGRPPGLPVRDGRIAIVGGGKGAAGMAAGVAEVLAAGGVRGVGLVSVPAGCGRGVAGVEVRETRPAAENLPTPAVVAATRQMLALVESLEPGDLAIAVISGGGSALLESPRAGVPLDELIEATSFLSAAGAGITEINAVRRAASDVKGGGLARACGAGRLLVLVLSDVVGDPLEFIASGPCLPAAEGPAAALHVLERRGGLAAGVAPRLVDLLKADADRPPSQPRPTASAAGDWTTPRGCRVTHHLVGSNATAVDAAAAAAAELGSIVTLRPAVAGPPETADEAGRRLAHEGLALLAAARSDGRPRAIIEGGEAVVRLPRDHGTGGRNQQTTAAALVEVLRSGPWPSGLLIASIGTDGEDGPTAAAGGLADESVAARIGELRLDAAAALARCDAHPLLEKSGGLVVTGPTGTNVADVRIVLARA